MDTSDIIWYVVVGLMVIFVGGIGVGSVIYSYYDQARAKRERRDRPVWDNNQTVP